MPLLLPPPLSKLLPPPPHQRPLLLLLHRQSVLLLLLPNRLLRRKTPPESTDNITEVAEEVRRGAEEEGMESPSAGRTGKMRRGKSKTLQVIYSSTTLYLSEGNFLVV